MNSGAVRPASPASKRAICTRATPSAENISSLSRSVDKRGGALPGAKNSRGCGSKVSTVGGSARSSAASTRRESIA